MPADKNPTKVAITYNGATVTKNQSMSVNPYYEFRTTNVTVKLLDSNGNTLDGGTAQYRAGGWRVFGDGKANSSMELLPATYTFEVSYAGATQTQDVDIKDTDKEVEVVFQTTKVTVKLLDSKGNPLDGGTAQYRASGWRAFGDGKANSSMELLPATYTFEVNYNGASQVKNDVVISKGKENVVVFQTVSVILHYKGGTMQYYSGGWKPYTGALEMLPVSIRFELQRSGWPTQYFYITPVEGQVYEKTIAVIRLVDSSGNGIKDGVASYRDDSWHSLGNTDKDGVYLAQLDGKRTGSLTFRMTLGSVYTQKMQNLLSDSFVLFQTKKVTVKLIDSNGNELEDTARYRDDSWHDFGDGTTGSTMELLPTNYSFEVGYLGATVNKIHNVGDNPEVVFQTKKVSFKLLASDGKTELDGKASVRSDAWMDFGDTGRTGGTMELLPTNYTFKVEYLGASQQRIQNVGENPNVVFQTAKVSFNLLSSLGLPLKGDASFYSDGWHPFGKGKTGETIELLPVNYLFKAEYGGASIQKSQTIEPGIKNVVSFKTKLVLVNMYTKVKVLGLTVKVPLIGGKVSYYAGGEWKEMGKAPELKEMLPTSYMFALEFMGQRQVKTQNVADDATVEFEIPVDLYLKALKEGKI